MTTMYQRHLQATQGSQARLFRGASHRAEHFTPPRRSRPRVDWVSALLLAAAAGVLVGLYLINQAQRERYQRSLEAEADKHTLNAVTQAELAGFEHAIAALRPAVQLAWKAGLVEGQRACGSAQ